MHSVGPKEANPNRDFSRYAGAEAETWESGTCLEVTLDADGTSLQL
jgi:hypothetical protein